MVIKTFEASLYSSEKHFIFNNVLQMNRWLALKVFIIDKETSGKWIIKNKVLSARQNWCGLVISTTYLLVRCTCPCRPRRRSGGNSCRLLPSSSPRTVAVKSPGDAVNTCTQFLKLPGNSAFPKKRWEQNKNQACYRNWSCHANRIDIRANLQIDIVKTKGDAHTEWLRMRMPYHKYLQMGSLLVFLQSHKWY